MPLFTSALSFKQALLTTCCGIALLALLTCPPVNAEPSATEARAAQMFERIGGRDKWATLKNTINGSQQNRTTDPTVVYAVISMDFERPRFRIETTAPDLHLIRVVDGEDNSWRLRMSGNIEDLPQDRYAEEMAWYEAHLYRTLHRIAARDQALQLKSASDGGLEVYRDAKRLLWLKLDARGEPYAFGFYDDDRGSLSGPWDFVKDGVHHPRWISSADGTWRAAVKALEINVKLTEAMFTRPREK